jgi:poly [ADP-ribose] polymerase 2/3/4
MPTNFRWVRFASVYLSGYSLTKVYVGKLAKSTILSGFAALKELSEVINQPDSSRYRGFSNFRAACEELTSRYYS